MDRKILLISDSLEVREEALSYSLHLAKRIDAMVVLLVLLEGSCEKCSDKKPEDVFILYKEKFEERNVNLECWMRSGNPFSEFLKFIAGTGSYQAIIWGGDEEINFKRSSSGEHWLKKSALLVDSPLLVPYKK